LSSSRPFDPDKWTGDPDELKGFEEDLLYDPHLCERTFDMKHQAFCNGHFLGFFDGTMTAGSDFQILTTRVVATMADAMTPEQRRAAGEKLRSLEGDQLERRFFRGVADGMDELAAAGDG
jgi:hypothetical protein